MFRNDTERHKLSVESIVWVNLRLKGDIIVPDPLPASGNKPNAVDVRHGGWYRSGWTRNGIGGRCPLGAGTQVVGHDMWLPDFSQGDAEFLKVTKWPPCKRIYHGADLVVFAIFSL